jgi:predicted ester cyclase
MTPITTKAGVVPTYGPPNGNWARAANTAVVRRLFTDVINGRKVEVLDELLDPEVVDHQKVVLTEADGTGGAAEGVRMLLDAFPDLSAEVLSTVADGDMVVVRFCLVGTNTGAYRYLGQATGRRAAWEAIAMFRMDAGRVVEIWGCADRMGMLTQLGILPAVG